MHFTHKAGLALALPLLTAAFAATTHAQGLTLQSGDNVTVNSTGTNGTYHGAPISNSTNSYVGNFTASNSTFTLSSGGSIDANNGNGLDATNSTINISGGSITNAHDDPIAATGGTVTISGGTLTGFEGLFTTNAMVNISGGDITGTPVRRRIYQRRHRRYYRRHFSRQPCDRRRRLLH